MLETRLKFTLILFFVFGLGIIIRLGYWQIFAGEALAALATSQHQSQVEIPASRGRLITADGFTLVGNQPAYLVYAYLPQIDKSPQDIAKLLTPFLLPEPDDTATPSPKATEASLAAKLTNSNTVWTALARKIPEDKQQSIQAFNLSGIGFESEPTRFYPEASMAAHLLGFVGSDVNGNPKGYFGLEGYYDLELKGRPGIIRQEKDATGNPILVGNFTGYEPKDGRDLQLYLDRSVQRLVELELASGLERYGAASGEVVIIDPKTGGIIAAAALPAYDPRKYSRFDKSLYKNPIVAGTYEPGSTFKVLVMAAGLDADVIEPDTHCDICSGPVDIGQYTIRTWNQEYTPDQTMTEVLEHSDNVGMVFVGQKLGKQQLYDYLVKFGIGQATGVDLQEETSPTLRPADKWADVDLATISFGQGIAVTAIQMVRAVAAIANDGVLMQPHLAKTILGDTPIDIPPQVTTQVISKDTAGKITGMMVAAFQAGEAQWTKMKGYSIAGKTGTAQIPVAGHYDKDKTIASFVGFAPADDPKFVMLVKLREPTSSPWAAETSAPLWTRIAKHLFLYYGISPSED